MRASGVPKRHGLRQRIRCGGATRSRFNQGGGGRRFQPHFASNQQSAVQRRQILPERRRGLVKVENLGTMGRLSVCDQGPGVPDDYKTRIHEKFIQVDAASPDRNTAC